MTPDLPLFLKARSAKPYIGITGVCTAADVEVLRQCALLVPSTHRMMGGVLMSDKSRLGMVSNKRYPAWRDVQHLLWSLQAAGCWATVHFNARGDLLPHLVDLAVNLPAMQGLQLNVVCPDPAVIRAFKNYRPDVEVILQANGSSMRRFKSVAEFAEPYRGLVQHVLYDPSGGRGTPLSADKAMTLAAEWEWSEWGLGIAGGLGPDAGGHLRDALLLPALTSLDAESRTRSPIGESVERYQDALDPEKALGWVRVAAEAVRGVSP